MMTKISTKTMPNGEEKAFECFIDLDAAIAKHGKERIEYFLLKDAIAHDFANYAKSANRTYFNVKDGEGVETGAKKPSIIAEHKAFWMRVEAGDKFDMSDFLAIERGQVDTSDMTPEQIKQANLEKAVSKMAKLAKTRKLTDAEKLELSAAQTELIAML